MIRYARLIKHFLKHKLMPPGTLRHNGKLNEAAGMTKNIFMIGKKFGSIESILL